MVSFRKTLVGAFLNDDPNILTVKFDSATDTSLFKVKSVCTVCCDLKGAFGGFTQAVIFSIGIGIVFCENILEIDVYTVFS